MRVSRHLVNVTLSAKDMFSTVHDGTEKLPKSPCSKTEPGLFCFLAPTAAQLNSNFNLGAGCLQRRFYPVEKFPILYGGVQHQTGANCCRY